MASAQLRSVLHRFRRNEPDGVEASFGAQLEVEAVVAYSDGLFR